MNDVDLTQLIDRVRYYRTLLSKAEIVLEKGQDFYMERLHDHYVNGLSQAEHNLATLMIELQEVYDLGLVPKSPLKDYRVAFGTSEDEDYIPF